MSAAIVPAALASNNILEIVILGNPLVLSPRPCVVGGRGMFTLPLQWAMWRGSRRNPHKNSMRKRAFAHKKH
jgi:hypothetical protein